MIAIRIGTRTQELRGRKMMVPVKTGEARTQLLAALEDFCTDFNAERFLPILEADIAGYLFHRLLVNGCPLDQIHLATRVCGKMARSRKPDVVIGALNRATACVVPVLIAEIKVFQRWGHSDQQMRHRFSGLIAEDLVSLEESASVLHSGRIEVVFDLYVSARRRGYLTGTWEGKMRGQLVESKCRDIGAEFVWLHPNESSDDIVCTKII